MAGNVTLWCTLIPALGKEARLRKVLLDLADKVKEVELECLKYQVIESTVAPDGESRTTFYLLERWTSEGDLEKHTKRDWLVDVRNTFSTEELLINDETIHSVKVIGGFGARY